MPKSKTKRGTKHMSKTATKAASETFVHDALVIRTCGADGSSYNGFRWPLEVGAMVECPDWKPRAEGGNGLHGLLDGIGDWSLIDSAPGRRWQVIGVQRDEVVVIDGGKVKFPRGKVLYVGEAATAFGMIQDAQVKAILAKAEGNTATGDRGHAAATGYSGHAAATGDSGHAAATGDRGHAAATGDSGHAAATGNQAIAASLGIEASAQAGPDGWIVLAQWAVNKKTDRWEIITVRAAKVGGPEGIKPNVAYRLDQNGEFVEVGQ